MIVLDLSILNQKGTPMFNSDTFANRPAFGIVGRIFISIDTAAIYRDTGTAWDLIADGGSASTNIYNSNGTLTGNRVLSDGGFGLSFIPTTHIGTAAIGGGGNGKLIVGSSTADNGIQVFGANAPSIRIDNAQSGGTQRFVFGLATATNNFIQGATAGQFCISTQSAGNMLFGMWQTTNASEVMRITTTNNLLIGSSVDNGNRLQIYGTGYINNTLILDGTNTAQYLNFYNSGVDRAHIYWQESLNNLSIGTYVAGGAIQFEVGNNVDAMFLNSSGNLGLGVNPSAWRTTNPAFQIGQSTSLFSYSSSNIGGLASNAFINSSGNEIYIANGFSSLYQFGNNGEHIWSIAPSGTAGNAISFTQVMTLKANGNLLVGTTTDGGQKMQVNGTVYANGITVGAALHWNGMFYTAGAAPSYIQLANGSTGAGASNGLLVGLDGGGNAYLNQQSPFSLFLRSNGINVITIKSTGIINMSGIPTTAVGLVSGDIYSNAGILTIVP